MRPIERILVPTDFSTGAQAALRFALQLAKPIGASITLLHVSPPPTFMMPEGSVVMTTAMAIEQLESSTRAALEGLRQQFADEGVTIHARSIAGTPAVEIVETAKESNYDLIVMGTHGRTGLRHMLLGSVAERVVRLAACPVLTVHEQFGEGPHPSV